MLLSSIQLYAISQYNTHKICFIDSGSVINIYIYRYSNNTYTISWTDIRRPGLILDIIYKLCIVFLCHWVYIYYLKFSLKLRIQMNRKVTNPIYKIKSDIRRYKWEAQSVECHMWAGKCSLFLITWLNPSNEGSCCFS